MKKLLIVPVAVAACAPTAVVTRAPVEEAPVATIPAQPPPTTREPPRDAPAAMEKGTTLLQEQFFALDENAIAGLPYEQRVKAIGATLGVEGAPGDDPPGMEWYALTLGSMIAPVGCHRMIAKQSYSRGIIKNAAFARCGLPFAADPTKVYKGPRPKRTTFALDKAFGEIGILSPTAALVRAHTLLGKADSVIGGEEVWSGLGPRGKDAPFTCKSMFVGARARIEDAPLDRCNIAWPIPGASFEPGPPVPLTDPSAALAECASKCTAQDMCVIDERIPFTADLATYPGGIRASYEDGMPAPLALVASCAHVAPTCQSPDGCFATMIKPVGPCPKDGNVGYGFYDAPRRYLTCISHVGKRS